MDNKKTLAQQFAEDVAAVDKAWEDWGRGIWEDMVSKGALDVLEGREEDG